MKPNVRIIILLLLVSNSTFAQYNYLFEHISTADGLSNGRVSAMLKDKKGFMWFATWDGLNRYDGTEFKVYNQADLPNCSSSNRITALREDAFGNIWVLTSDAKAFRLNRRNEQFETVSTTYSDSLKARVKEVYTFPDGEVWVATQNAGISRVITDSENNEFVVEAVHTDSSPKLPSNSIYFIFQDTKQRIWVNTSDGLSVFEYEPSKLQPKILTNGLQKALSGKQIVSYFAGEQEVFLGTENGEVFGVKTQNFAHRKLALANTAKVTHIDYVANGMIYIGTYGNGILVYNPWKNEVERHYRTQEIRNVLTAYPDTKGLLWVESSEAGISCINLFTHELRNFRQKLDVAPDIQPYAQCGLKEDEHYLWLTLKGGGFGYYDYRTEKLNYFFNEPGSPDRKLSNFVRCFYNDSAGVLWMSTYFRGLEKVTLIDKQFRYVQPDPISKLSTANEIRALQFDSRGNLWVATKKEELYIFSPKLELMKKFTTFGSEKIGRIYALFEASDERMYVGTKGNGLFILSHTHDFEFSTQHFVENKGENSLSNNNIYSIIEDEESRIWIATYGGGVNLFDGQQFYNAKNKNLNYPIEQGAKVRHIHLDARNNLWFATTNGLFFLGAEDKCKKNYRFRHFNKEQGTTNGLLGNDVFWIMSDRNNQLWVSSLGGGLARLLNYPDTVNLLQFNAITQKDGLSSDMVYTATCDAHGNIWMATENGISSFDPQTKLMKHYDQNSGLENVEMTEASLAVDANGNIVFGSDKGFYHFQPALFKEKEKQIDLTFTDFKVFGKSLRPAQNTELEESITSARTVSLSHEQHAFSVHWSALDYAAQNQYQFRYKLEGYDNDWQLTDENNYAAYSKVPPGKYTFVLEFLNPEFRQKNSAVSLQIKVKPPFWRTHWAFLTYALMFLILLDIVRRTATTIIRLRNKIVIEKELSEVKIDFFTNISHELRTPLTLILGPTRELKSSETLSEKGKNYINLIESNTSRLLSLVNQLLDFRKIQQKKMELRTSFGDISMLINRVATNFKAKAVEKNMQFRVCGAENELRLLFDSEKMETVLFNLLSNAFKFTPTGGKIDIELKKPSENTIEIEITDNGIGISKAQEKRLFKPFMSEGYAVGSEIKGTGIGLALSKEIVELHGGKLNYTALKTGGSVFKVSLPKKLPLHQKTQKLEVFPRKEATEKEAIPTAVHENSANGKHRILIVEDNPDVRAFLHLQLSEQYEVEQAKNGREGLEKATTAQPDIILSDIMMPEMDGIELLDRLKHTDDTSHIPVVLLSAKTSVESRIEGLRYGADAYLTKPFQSEQLKAQLENLLAQRAKLRELFSQQQKTPTKKQESGLTEKDANFLQNVRKIIEENLSNPDFKMETLYSEVGMGRSKFYNKIRGLVGVSPIDFVKDFRLNKAHDLIVQGEITISEISYTCGFSDPSYFSKCFKEKFGVAPSKLK